MSGEQQEQEIVVAIEPDTPDQQTGGAAVATNGAGNGAAASDPAVDDLASQYKALQERTQRLETDKQAEARRADQATREALLANQRAAAAQTEIADSHLGTVQSGISAAHAKSEAARRDIRLYGEQGDFEKQAEAYERLADARAELGRLDEAKADIETRRQAEPAPRRQAPTEAAHVAPPVDPVEAYVQGRTAPTAQWLRAHPEWVTDQKKNASLTAAHYDAVAKDIAVDSTEYFTHVETFVGLRQAPAANGNGAQQRQAPARRQSAPVAPVSHSAGGTNGGGPEVRLTAGEARAATDGTHVWNYDDQSGKNRFKKGDPIGHQEFARRKLALTQQGAYDRTYTDA